MFLYSPKYVLSVAFAFFRVDEEALNHFCTPQTLTTMRIWDSFRKDQTTGFVARRGDEDEEERSLGWAFALVVQYGRYWTQFVIVEHASRFRSKGCFCCCFCGALIFCFASECRTFRTNRVAFVWWWWLWLFCCCYLRLLFRAEVRSESMIAILSHLSKLLCEQTQRRRMLFSAPFRSFGFWLAYSSKMSSSADDWSCNSRIKKQSTLWSTSSRRVQTGQSKEALREVRIVWINARRLAKQPQQHKPDWMLLPLLHKKNHAPDVNLIKTSCATKWLPPRNVKFKA